MLMRYGTRTGEHAEFHREQVPFMVAA